MRIPLFSSIGSEFPILASNRPRCIFVPELVHVQYLLALSILAQGVKQLSECDDECSDFRKQTLADSRR